MAFSRFTLDTSQLDDATVGLNGSPFPLNATGASSLGGVSANASATITKLASASSSLGGVSASASATITVRAIASSSLGGVNASASAQSTIFPVLSSSLGGLSASATARSTIFPVLSAPLDGLSASASAQSTIFPVFDAPLDGLVASATATINPPEPPPVGDGVGYQQPYRQRPLRKQVKPVEIPIQIEVIPERTIIVAQGMSRLGGIDCLALGSIIFSTLADDAEVLLLI